MTQATFEVQTFDGHGWVTRHRGADVDAAGEAARRVLPDAKRHAVRIVKQSYDAGAQRLDNQVVFALGKPRRHNLRRLVGIGAALAVSAAAMVGATVLPTVSADGVAEMAEALVERATAAAVPAEPASELPALVPAAGIAAADRFECRREADAGLIRATNLPPERDRLYRLCAEAVTGDADAQVALAAQLVAGEGADADPEQAALWLQEAARAGHAPAYRPLADLLIALDDPARAVSWYHRAATGGDVEAAVILAARYRTGDGVERDERVALSYELMAADAGDTAAMLRVADAFAAGDGADANLDASERWRARASAAGAEGATATPSLQWAAPAAGGEVPQATWTAPALADLLPVPPLHLDIDHDAQEAFSAFATGPLASV